MSLDLYAAYLVACLIIVIVPGPTVTLIVANSLRHGRRAGLLNVAGGQLGLAIVAAIALMGLASLIAAMGAWFAWVRLAGAAYLIWLGWKLLTASGESADAAPRSSITTPSTIASAAAAVRDCSRISAARVSTCCSDVPCLSARSLARWMTGPSATGSLKGTPSSITLAPASMAARMTSRVVTRSGSPQVT